jgi:hypothetical protein
LRIAALPVFTDRWRLSKRGKHTSSENRTRRNDYMYAVMDKRPLRALSLLMALLLAGCIFWDPSRFAAKPAS